MVIEGDFVPAAVETTLEPGTGYNVFTFPAIDGSPTAVIGAGDFVVMFKDSPAAQALVEYLTTVEAGEKWATRGIATPNKNVDPSLYPDELVQRLTAARRRGGDLPLRPLRPAARRRSAAPSARGLFKLFQDFLPNPEEIDGITQEMEDAATRHSGSRCDALARAVRRRRLTGAPPPASSRGALEIVRNRGRRSSRPRLVLLIVWIVYPTFHTIYRSFFDRSGRRVRRVRQLQRDLQRRHARHRAQEQRPVGAVRAGVRDRDRAGVRGPRWSACASRSRSRRPCSCRWRSRSSPPA